MAARRGLWLGWRPVDRRKRLTRRVQQFQGSAQNRALEWGITRRPEVLPAFVRGEQHTRRLHDAGWTSIRGDLNGWDSLLFQSASDQST